jgi:hypothetical protein
MTDWSGKNRRIASAVTGPESGKKIHMEISEAGRGRI